MSVSILNMQPQTEITGSYKKESDKFRIIIVWSPYDTKICVFFPPNAYAQINELRTFYKRQHLTKRFKNLHFLFSWPVHGVGLGGQWSFITPPV